jgi:hypothetical protein
MAKLQDLLEELKHSGESLTGDSLGEASTFNAQCFLIQHMFEIAPLAEAKRAINVESKRNRNPDIDSNQTPDLGQGSPPARRAVRPPSESLQQAQRWMSLRGMHTHLVAIRI